MSLVDTIKFLIRLMTNRVLQKRTDNSTDELKDGEEIWRLSEIVARDSWYRAQITVASSTPFRVTQFSTLSVPNQHIIRCINSVSLHLIHR